MGNYRKKFILEMYKKIRMICYGKLSKNNVILEVYKKNRMICYGKLSKKMSFLVFFSI